MRLPVVRGPIAGSWWLPQAGGKVLRVLAAGYEPEQTRLFEKVVRPGDTVLDLGAHAGYYSLLSSRLVGETGRVLAFEPNPRNFGYLERHVAVNRLRNVSALQAAVADTEGTARFKFGTGSGTGHLAAAGELEVRTVTLDRVCTERAVVPNVVKIDVEGAELSVLEGGRELFNRHGPAIFLSTHGSEVHARCLEWLSGVGYRFESILGSDVHATSELLCVR